MLAAAKALQAPREWYANMNKIYRERRVIAEQIMDALGCSYDKNQSGMFLWGKMPEHYKNSEELSNKILYEACVFITPGFIFGSNGERYIRISLCCKKETLEEALNRIKNQLIHP
jgi:aspartate/methionine/tyrosine aminotransferase